MGVNAGGREAEDDALHGQEQEAGGGDREEEEEEEVAGAPCSPWPPRRGRPQLHVAIPGSVLSVEPGLRSKTVKAGFIARALAVYRVDRVVVYEDPDTRPEDARLLHKLLRYAATPPHLRRRLYRLQGDLRYAGLLPPLQTASHLVPDEPRPGAVLDGLVVRVEGRRCLVWLGRAGHALVEDCRAGRGEVVTVKILEPGDPARAKPSSWGCTYTGYAVTLAGGLAAVAKRYKERGYAVIATSRYGACARGPPTLRPPGALIVFGGPRRGVLDYTPRALYDQVLNTVPGQGTRTVRTEEALHATLALININRGDACGGR